MSGLQPVRDAKTPQKQQTSFKTQYTYFTPSNRLAYVIVIKTFHGYYFVLRLSPVDDVIYALSQAIPCFFYIMSRHGITQDLAVFLVIDTYDE